MAVVPPLPPSPSGSAARVCLPHRTTAFRPPPQVTHLLLFAALSTRSVALLRPQLCQGNLLSRLSVPPTSPEEAGAWRTAWNASYVEGRRAAAVAAMHQAAANITAVVRQLRDGGLIAATTSVQDLVGSGGEGRGFSSFRNPRGGARAQRVRGILVKLCWRKVVSAMVRGDALRSRTS